MAKQHDKQFKLDAVQYYQDHKDLGVRGCAENLGIGYSTLTKSIAFRIWIVHLKNFICGYILFTYPFCKEILQYILISCGYKLHTLIIPPDNPTPAYKHLQTLLPTAYLMLKSSCNSVSVLYF